VLIVGPDAALVAELRSAFQSLDDLSPVLRHVAEFRGAGEAARSWRPDVALVEMDANLDRLRNVAREIAAASPETCLVGVFRGDLLRAEESESALLIQAIRLGVKDFVRRPISRRDLAELFGRLADQPTRAPAKIGKLVSFISNKGGVGKTTLATNTAVQLARKFPERVLLVDASLQMGLCAPLLGLRPRTTILDAARERQRLDETLIRQLATPHESGLDLLAATADAIEATEVDDEIVARALALARRTYDYVIVDTFPLFDRVVMSVLDVSDRTYIVTDNLVPTVLGLAKLLEVLGNLDYPADRQAVVVNRSLRVLGSLNVGDIEARLGRDVAHHLPFEKRVVTAGNIGKPFILQPGWFSRACSGVRALAEEVSQLTPASTASTETFAVTVPAAPRPGEPETARGALSSRAPSATGIVPTPVTPS
jgi:pilus assembly protein CpaE